MPASVARSLDSAFMNMLFLVVSTNDVRQLNLMTAEGAF